MVVPAAVAAAQQACPKNSQGPAHSFTQLLQCAPTFAHLAVRPFRCLWTDGGGIGHALGQATWGAGCRRLLRCAVCSAEKWPGGQRELRALRLGSRSPFRAQRAARPSGTRLIQPKGATHQGGQPAAIRCLSARYRRRGCVWPGPGAAASWASGHPLAPSPGTHVCEAWSLASAIWKGAWLAPERQ